MVKISGIFSRRCLCFYMMLTAMLAPGIVWAAASPSITTQPQSQSVGFRSNAVFTVVANGNTPLFYQWTFNGTNLVNNSHIGGAAGTALTVSNVVSTDAGNYRVIVSNSHGSVTSSVAVLTVLFTNQVHFVNSSNVAPLWPFADWATAATNIQDAVDAAVAGDRIFVTNGIYTLGNRVTGTTTNCVVVTNAVSLIAVSGPAQTIVNGGGVKRCFYLEAGSSLSGFTVTNGWTMQNGGGVFCASTNVVITNCVVTGNYADVQGGGVYQGALMNCSLLGNSAAGAAMDYKAGGGASSSWLSNCIVAGNKTGDHAALYGQGAGLFNCVATRCVITNNASLYSGAAGASGGTLNNCLIANNSAGGWAGGADGAVLNNCTVVGNIAGAGAGGGIDFSTANNCIILNNYLVWGVFNGFATPDQTNCANSTVNYSCSTPLMTNGVGNITSVPVFMDPNADWHLQASSPCINAGNNSYVTGDKDLDANPRIVGSTLDMGAYEYQAATIAITAQPANQAPFLGQTAEFNVAAISPFALGYQWLFNGTNIAGATNATLTISDVQMVNAGNYQVIITNAFLSATSAVATLTVLVPPNTWVKWDAGLGGNGHTYKAVINTNGLNWLQADQIAHDEGGYLATITSAAENNFVFSLVNDPGFFSGSGGNGSGPALGGIRTNSASSADADWTWETGEPWSYTAWTPGQPDFMNETRLQFWSGTQGIPSPAWNNLTPTDSNLGGYVIEREDFPAILNQPANATVAASSNATFTVVALGAPTLMYQWLFNGTNLDGATNASLTLTGVQFVQAGNYSVIVSNTFGSVTSSNATLTVMTPPAITQSPTNLTLLTGTTAIFSGAATGDLPLSYRWQFNGSPLSDSSRVFGSATDTLTISNIQSSDTGSYTLVVTNPVGSATSTAAALAVLTPAAITTQPLGRSTPLGLSNVLSAAASGSAPLLYQWQLNGTNIPGATNNSYIIAAITTNDLGTYRFIASNTVSVAVSSNALVTIGPVAAWGLNTSGQCIVPPGLSNVTAIAGSLTCSLTAQTDGSVAGWGSSVSSTTNTSWTNVVALSASYNGGLALRSDGSVMGSSVATISPLSAKLSFSNAIAVSAGYQHGLALRAEGTVVGWQSTQLSAGNYPPALVPPGLTHVTAISAGYQHSLALRSNGTVAAWGIGAATNVPIGLSNVVAIAAGTTHSLALKADGTVVAWGTGTGVSNLPPALSNVVAIAADTYSDQRITASFAVKSNGTLVAWGLSASPPTTNIPTGLNNVVAVAFGVNHALALVNDGSPQIIRAPVGGVAWSGSDYVLKVVAAGTAKLNYQWLFNGTNLDGATNATLLIAAIQATNSGNYQVIVSNTLGVAASLPVPVTVMDSAPFLLTQSPTNVNGWLGNKLSLSAAAGGSGPLQYQWRLNGTDVPGATNDTLTFSRLHLTNSGNYSLFISNSFGAVTSSIIKLTVQQVVVWGDNSLGQTNMPPGLTNIIAIGANFNNNIVLRDNGTVTVWGNTSGLYVPTNSVAGVSNVVEVSAGYNQELVLKANGRPYLWGQGTSSSTTNTVAAQSNIVAVVATSSSGNCAMLRADGTLLQIFSSSVTTNNGVTNGIALATCDDGYLVLRADGKIYSYGGGLSVAGVSNAVTLAAGRYQGLALKRDGMVMGVESFPVWPGVTNYTGVIDVASAMAFNSTPEFIVLSDGSIVMSTNLGSFSAVTNVPYGINSVQVLHAGNSHCLALLSDRDFPPIFLHTALNTTNYVVSSKGSAQWLGQTNVSHDGSSAAQSAAIGNNTASSMRMWIYGPTSAKFWCKVSSATNHGILSFSSGGTVLTNISGEVDWRQVTVNIPRGGQILQWTYSKDGAAAAGLDTAWVDQLQFTNIPPTILTQPVGQTVIGGTNVIAAFTVTVAGTPPFSYRWNKDASPFVVHTNAGADSLTFVNVARADSGTYSVVVTNLAGSATSSNAVLDVHVPQLLGTPTILPDGTLAFSGTDADGAPISPAVFANLQLQVSTNLVDWTTLPNALGYSNGMIQVHDAGAANYDGRFYRIIENW